MVRFSYLAEGPGATLEDETRFVRCGSCLGAQHGGWRGVVAAQIAVRADHTGQQVEEPAAREHTVS